MNTKKNIYWSDGLFLKPHHFQFIDKKTNDNLTFILDKIYPKNYGFVEYKIDLANLKEGILSLSSCELFINDTIINYPINSNIIMRKIKDEIKIDKNKKYYLGVKKQGKDNTNIEITHIKQLNSNNTRYTNVETEFEKVSNVYNTQDKIDFSYVKYTLQFFCEEEIASLVDYDLISLCIIKNKNKTFILEENFLPPLLHIDDNHTILKTVNSTFKLIVNIMKELEGDRLKSQNLIILSNINPLIIDFQSIQKKSYVVPYDIFTNLQKMLSVLIVFTKDYNMDIFLNLKSNLLQYNHENIFESFTDLCTMLANILDEIIGKKSEIQREFIFNFKKSEDKLFIDIDKKFFDKKYIFYIEFIHDNKDKLIENIHYLKISNREFIDSVISSSISDIGFKVQAASNLKFPIASSSIYIKLDISQKNWDKIVKTKNLALYIDKDLIKEANLVLLDDVNE
jgi:type VI secretion system protein ImpJ